MDTLFAPSLNTSGYRYAPSRRSRAGSALAALAIVALILLVLWRMGLLDQGRSGAGTRFTSVSLQSGEQQAASPHAAARAAHTRQASKIAPVQTVRLQPKVVIKPPPVISTKPAPAFIAMSGADMAAADISKLKGRGAGSAGAGAAHGSTYGPGEGPGGLSLVNVAWYREPTDAELGPYLPHKLPPRGWATIACRMIEHYHVEDCQELAESPPGSGLSRALRQAAWQFQVRPPMVGGKPQLGTWVRIRFTWSNRADAADPDE